MKSVLRVFLVLMLFITTLPLQQKADAAAGLLISEYIEGSGYNKAIEIYNPSNESVDLSKYTLVSFINGASETSGTVGALKLSGTIAPNDVFVIAHGSAAPEILAQTDLKSTSNVMNFNGDDTLVLFENYDAATKTGVVIDSIGQVGYDPGTAFVSGDVSTVDMTLVRTNEKLVPDTDIHNRYNPADQFIALPKDTTTEIGVFNGDVKPPAPEVPKAQYDVQVVRVVDGDTIKISPTIMGSDTIRFVNMDTPETYHLTSYDSALIDSDPDHNQKYHGEISKAALNEMLSTGMDITVKVNPDHITDDYGRVLGQVVRKSDAVNINLEMVKSGMATTYFIWPVLNMDDYTMFQNAARQAMDNHLGIWQKEHPLKELPFAFRARYDGKGFLRYIGNSDTKVYYDPKNFDQVPVDKRIFFTQEEAIAQGYKPAPGNGGTLPEETAKQMSIKEARELGKGTKAIVSGTVTHIDGYNVYIQDNTAGMVIRTKTIKPEIGDVIEATGETGEYFGLYQMETEAINVQGKNEVLAVDKALNDISEDEEAKLIRIKDVTIQSVNEFNEYTVTDAAGHSFLVKTKDSLEIGKTFESIEGVVTYSYNAYKLLPTKFAEKKPVVKHQLSGFVFYDTNHNGQFDTPDRLMNDVEVSLLENGQVKERVKTVSGHYAFETVAGDYTVTFTAPANLIETFKDKAAESVDSDIQDGSVKVVVSNQDISDITAGFTKNVGKMKKR